MCRKMMVACLLLAMAVLFVGADADAMADVTLTWQGYELRVISITTDEDEITEVFKEPIPADGFLVLANLTTTDGSAIDAGTSRECGNEFLLTDADGNVERPMSVNADNGNLALIFYHRQWWPQSADRTLTLSVSPLEKVPDAMLSAILTWQGMQIKVASATSDRAALAGWEWPDEGYLLRIQFEAENQAAVLDDAVAIYKHEIILTDGNQRKYRAIDAVVPSNPGVFSLIYCIDGTPIAAMDSLTLNVKPNAALWMDGYFDEANTQPFQAFCPKNPQAHRIAIALEDASMFAYDSGAAIAEPEDALSATEATLGDIRSELLELFDDNDWGIAGDSDLASVVIGVHINYPLAGRYGVGGSIRAFNCVLTLTAYDPITKEKITSLQVGSFFGNTISVSIGSSVIWKHVPSIAAVDEAKKDAFVSDLRDFWETWEKP